MKLKKIVAATVMLIVITCALCACSLFGGTNNGNTNKDARYSVTVYYEGYQASNFVNAKTGTYTLPKVEPTREGYDFEGWFLDADRTVPLVPGEKANLTFSVYPKFTKKLLSVKIIDTAGGKDTVVKIEYGEKADIQAPTKPGYIFDGWFTDRDCTEEFDTKTVITENVEIYSKWVYATYTIKYETNGGTFAVSPVEFYTINDETELGGVSKKNYDFDGWYLESDFSGKRYTTVKGLTGDVTLYAKYLCLLAEMGVKEGISDKIGDEFVYYTDHTAHDVDIRECFVFSEGSTITLTAEDGTITDGIASLEANDGLGGVKNHDLTVTVKAEEGDAENTYKVKICQYDESTVKVTYVVNGVVKAEKNVARGDKADMRGIEVGGAKKGYEFDCWLIGGVEFDVESPVIEDITLEAAFKPINYRIVYKLGIGMNSTENPSEYNIESDFVLKNAVAPDGYTFDNWYADEEYSDIVTVLTGRTEEITLYARYELTDPIIKKFVATGKSTYNLPRMSEDETPQEVTADTYEVTKEEYPYLLDYFIFHRTETAEITVSGIGAITEDGFYLKAAGKYPSAYKVTASFNNEGKVWIRFVFDEEPTMSSKSGTYEQINFTSFAKKGSRNAWFDDFAIEHVKNSLRVESGSQLYFALENGYRPKPVSGSTAEKVYDEMKKILRQIVSDGMTEREKVMAISEWLVKNVAYDNAVYDKFLNNEDVSEYRCFEIEGAIIDKVAVCDGISKAFSAFCATEGIKAVRPSGWHNGIAHAWNKVYIDVDNDGNKEWTAVDCTSANTLFKTKTASGTVEIMNHSFIFASDDFLINKNGYVYSEEWTGKCVAKKSFDVYSKTYYDNSAEYNFDVKDASDLERIVAKMKSEEIGSGKSTVIDFRVSKESMVIIRTGEENRYSETFTQALIKAGYSYDDINERLQIGTFNVQEDGKVGVYIFMLSEGETADEAEAA